MYLTLKIYNTLTGKKEEFVPREPGKVSIYACGVTPYNYAHIGNARPPVFWDCARRFLKYHRYDVTYIQNFTDVDDKIINRAAQLKRDPLELAAEYATLYLEDLKALGVLPADKYPKVSEHIPEIIEMIQALVDKGYAYRLDGDVYYSVAKFKDYGKLSGRALDELRAGARVEVNEAKQDPMDFALWKAAKPGEISWDSPWGPGRPGWHIECSAMSLKYLGNGFDMHGGGEDLVFPHHENEIAQSEAYSGKQFVKYWLHNAFVTISGERMGKSLGNFSTIRDVREKFPPKVIRFWLLGTHYRNPVNFGAEELNAAAKGLERLEIAVFNWKHQLNVQTGDGARASARSDPELLKRLEEIITRTEQEFTGAMEDDFNTPQALASLHELAREINRWVQNNDFQPTIDAKQILTEAVTALTTLGGILGIFYKAGTDSRPNGIDEAQIEENIARRTQAKKDKNWALADQIRDELKNKGVIIEDTPQGVRWRFE
jgi:cysteinyl-tRNA synthetase